MQMQYACSCGLDHQKRSSQNSRLVRKKFFITLEAIEAFKQLRAYINIDNDNMTTMIMKNLSNRMTYHNLEVQNRIMTIEHN